MNCQKRSTDQSRPVHPTVPVATDITLPSPRTRSTPHRSGEYDQGADHDHHDCELKKLTELHIRPDIALPTYLLVIFSERNQGGESVPKCEGFQARHLQPSLLMVSALRGCCR
jgi:hypothetical protein